MATTKIPSTKHAPQRPTNRYVPTRQQNLTTPTDRAVAAKYERVNPVQKPKGLV